MKQCAIKYLLNMEISSNLEEMNVGKDMRQNTSSKMIKWHLKMTLE